MCEYLVRKDVQPGESLAVTFRLKSIAGGRFSGDVDICNPNQDFTTLFADVVVKEERSNNRVDEIGAGGVESSR